MKSDIRIIFLALIIMCLDSCSIKENRDNMDIDRNPERMMVFDISEDTDRKLDNLYYLVYDSYGNLVGSGFEDTAERGDGKSRPLVITLPSRICGNVFDVRIWANLKGMDMTEVNGMPVVKVLAGRSANFLYSQEIRVFFDGDVYESEFIPEPYSMNLRVKLILPEAGGSEKGWNVCKATVFSGVAGYYLDGGFLQGKLSETLEAEFVDTSGAGSSTYLFSTCLLHQNDSENLNLSFSLESEDGNTLNESLDYPLGKALEDAGIPLAGMSDIYMEINMMSMKLKVSVDGWIYIDGELSL